MVSSKLDKLKRDVNKCLRDARHAKHQLRSYMISLIVIGCLLLLGLWIFKYSADGGADPNRSSANANPVLKHPLADINKLRSKTFSDEVMVLYNKLLVQLNQSEERPSETSDDRIASAENNHYKRTQTVQALLDYAQAATKELHRSQYDSDAEFHHVQCMEAFSDAMMPELHRFETALRTLLQEQSLSSFLYTQSHIDSNAEAQTVTEHNHGGLPAIIGENGMFATRNISAWTLIGHYYGDEYMQHEFHAHFDWDVYSQPEYAQHPFYRKFDYYMTVPFEDYSDPRLNLEHLNMTVVVDPYFAYDHQMYRDTDEEFSDETHLEQQRDIKEIRETYINDARQNLFEGSQITAQDWQRKNLEFVYCAIDGILQTLLFSTCEIVAGEQLFTYYGPTYGLD